MLAPWASRGILRRCRTRNNLSLSADFPASTREQWRNLVGAVLKGAPFERLESRTYDGLKIEPLYERAAPVHPIAGRAPGTGWTIMQRVDHPDPATANAQALDDLQNGATGLALVFAGSVTANGFGVDWSAATLARILEGVSSTLAWRSILILVRRHVTPRARSLR